MEKLEQSISVRAVPELIVGIEAGTVVKYFDKASSLICSGQTMLKCIRKHNLLWFKSYEHFH